MVGHIQKGSSAKFVQSGKDLMLSGEAYDSGYYLTSTSNFEHYFAPINMKWLKRYHLLMRYNPIFVIYLILLCSSFFTTSRYVKPPRCMLEQIEIENFVLTHFF